MMGLLSWFFRMFDKSLDEEEHSRRGLSYKTAEWCIEKPTEEWTDSKGKKHKRILHSFEM